jgi:hypothetical protein
MDSEGMPAMVSMSLLFRRVRVRVTSCPIVVAGLPAFAESRRPGFPKKQKHGYSQSVGVFQWMDTFVRWGMTVTYYYDR